jgi:hypothetical protein
LINDDSNDVTAWEKGLMGYNLMEFILFDVIINPFLNFGGWQHVCVVCGWCSFDGIETILNKILMRVPR